MSGDEEDLSKLTKEEAVQLLNQAVAGQQMAVLSPALLNRLTELGVKVKVVEGESLDEFFEKARRHAHALVSDLPPMPNWLEYQFQRPYFEARCCLLAGLYGASITLSAVLLERILKWTAFCAEASQAKDLPAGRWAEIEEKKHFGDAVGYAKRWGLVDKSLARKLDQFCDEIRNVQSHHLVYKATKDGEFQDVNVVDFEKKTCVEGQKISAVINPTMSAIAKEKMDELNSKDVFIFMHQCMEHLFASMQRNLKPCGKNG